MRSTRRIVYGLDLISATDGGDQTYFLYDGLGSTTGLADGSGNVTASYGYDVFGGLRSGSPGATEWLFTGEQRDADSGMYYLRARYYDPEIGRFFTQDVFTGQPWSPTTLNRYVYVYNSPVLFVDPYGLWGLKDAVKGVKKVGVYVVSEIRTFRPVS